MAGRSLSWGRPLGQWFCHCTRACDGGGLAKLSATLSCTCFRSALGMHLLMFSTCQIMVVCANLESYLIGAAWEYGDPYHCALPPATCGARAESRRSRTSPVTHALPMHHQQNDACESATYALTRACASRAGVSMAHRCHCRVVGATGRLPRRGGARAERHLLCVHDIRDAGGYPPSHVTQAATTPTHPNAIYLCV